MKKLTVIFIGVIWFFSLGGQLNDAGAWTWKGFSGLYIDDTVRGPEGDTITFTLHDVQVYTQCYNVNTDNESQPGIGNSGDIVLVLDTSTEPTKTKGVVSVNGFIDLAIFDDHDYEYCYTDSETGEEVCIEHIHTCVPYDNPNKIEVEGTAWVLSFVADWIWKDSNGKIVNQGTDTCVWTGDIIDGYPEHDKPFECTSTSDKKINWYVEK